MSKQQSNKSGSVYRIADRACRIIQWLWLIFLTGICIGYLTNVVSLSTDPTKLVGILFSTTIGPVNLGPTLFVILVALIPVTMVSFFLRDRYKPAPDKKIQDVILESIQKLMKKEEELVDRETDPLTRMLEQQRTMTQEQQGTSSLLTKMLEQQRTMTQEQQGTSSLLTKMLEQQRTMTQEQQGTSSLLTKMLEQQRTMTQEQQGTSSLLIKMLEQQNGVTALLQRMQSDIEQEKVFVHEASRQLSDNLLMKDN